MKHDFTVLAANAAFTEPLIRCYTMPKPDEYKTILTFDVEAKAVGIIFFFRLAMCN